MIDYKIVSTELAVALVVLPRITMVDLYGRCKDKIGNYSLAQFRLEVAKWLDNGTIPGYESRKGPTGGIYKKGVATLCKPKKEAVLPTIDHVSVAEFLAGCLEKQTHITLKSLYLGLGLTILETEFNMIFRKWLIDGTIVGYEIKMGKTGGIYKVGSELDKWEPVINEDTVPVNKFSLQVSPSMRIVQLDERNWGIQRRAGEAWANEYYHHTLSSAINSVVGHIINGEFRLSSSTLLQLKDVLMFLKKFEDRLESKIENMANERNML